MIIEHFSDVPWDRDRWPNFTASEMSCRHCGEMYWAPDVFDGAQFIRHRLGAPVMINSAHRCWLHNAAVGGAPMSEHKRIALDLAIDRHDPGDLLSAAMGAGFTTFGFYGTFLHVDTRPGRRWSTAQGRRTWKKFLAS